MTNTLVERRIEFLQSRCGNYGFSDQYELSDLERELFGLSETEGSRELIERLWFLADRLQPSEELRAAWSALNMTDEAEPLHIRRDRRLEKYSRGLVDIDARKALLIEERHGFRSLAEAYDLAMSLQIFVGKVSELGEWLYIGAAARCKLEELVLEALKTP